MLGRSFKSADYVRSDRCVFHDDTVIFTSVASLSNTPKQPRRRGCSTSGISIVRVVHSTKDSIEHA